MNRTNLDNNAVDLQGHESIMHHNSGSTVSPPFGIQGVYLVLVIPLPEVVVQEERQSCQHDDHHRSDRCVDRDVGVVVSQGAAGGVKGDGVLNGIRIDSLYIDDGTIIHRI